MPQRTRNGSVFDLVSKFGKPIHANLKMSFYFNPPPPLIWSRAASSIVLISAVTILCLLLPVSSGDS